MTTLLSMYMFEKGILSFLHVVIYTDYYLNCVYCTSTCIVKKPGFHSRTVIRFNIHEMYLLYCDFYYLVKYYSELIVEEDLSFISISVAYLGLSGLNLVYFFLVYPRRNYLIP